MNSKGKVVAPLRIGLSGGGTDLKAFYEKFGGEVINLTVSKFITIEFERVGHFEVQLNDLGRQIIVDEQPSSYVGLSIVEAVVLFFVKRRPKCWFELSKWKFTTDSEVNFGSGLGVSSALVVGCIKAVATILGEKFDPMEIARIAVIIEREHMRLPGGIQDQFAAAVGGCNLFKVDSEGCVSLYPVSLPPTFKSTFDSMFCLGYVSGSRATGEIIQQQSLDKNRSHSVLSEMLLHSDNVLESLELGDLHLTARFINDLWAIKKRTSGLISTGAIDKLVSGSLQNGALCAKLSGAGGGGYVWALCPPEFRSKLQSFWKSKNVVLDKAEYVDRGVFLREYQRV